MAAILNSAMLDSDTAMLDSDTAILDSDTLLSSLWFTHKHFHSTLTLTQTNSVWLKLIHSHLTWWWQESWILPSWIWTSWIEPSSYFLSYSLPLAKIGSHHWHKINITHSFWLNLMMAAILNSAMLDSDTAILDSDSLLSSDSDSLKNTLTPLWCWLKLIQSDSNSFILTELYDGSHLEYYFLEFSNLGFSHHSMSSGSHLYLSGLVPIPRWPPFAQRKSTHSFWLNLMMAAILNSAMLDSDTAILDSDTLLSYLRFTQKHSHSTLMLTQTDSIWLKLIHSHWTWWWQPSWNLPCLNRPSLIQPS